MKIIFFIAFCIGSVSQTYAQGDFAPSVGPKDKTVKIEQIANYIGSIVVTHGKVADVKVAHIGKEILTLMYMPASGRLPPLILVTPSTFLKNFGYSLQSMIGKDIYVTGRVMGNKDELQMFIYSRGQIKFKAEDQFRE